MGPYDNLGSHMQVQLRLMEGRKLPADGAAEHVKDVRTHRISLVYAPDVVRAVMAVLAAGDSVKGEVLHIAQAEAPTILEYYEAVATALSLSDEAAAAAAGSRQQVTVELDEAEGLILPSVDIGPISIEKALRLLGPAGWRPTPMAGWLAETVAWNLDESNRHYTDHVDDD
jgi:nucleoside-diphosphate-sugar epimerase